MGRDWIKYSGIITDIMGFQYCSVVFAVGIVLGMLFMELW